MNILLLLTVLFGPVQQDGAGIISGLVLDMSGNPVANVKVVIVEASGELCGTALSDSSGRYSINQIPEGKKKVYFAHNLFKLKEVEVTINNYSREFFGRYQIEKGKGPDIWKVNLKDQVQYQDAVVFLESRQIDKALKLFLSFAAKHPYHVKNCFNVGLCYSHLASESRRKRRQEQKSWSAKPENII